MGKACSLFGHRRLFNERELREQLKFYIEENIKNGYKIFTVGTHGDFDKLALSVLRELRNIYKDIVIEVVFTSLIFLTVDKYGFSLANNYKDVQTITYIFEEVYFKKRITYSNQKMIDNSDLIICYVDMKSYRSGAKQTIKYAIKHNKKVLNLFNEKNNYFE